MLVTYALGNVGINAQSALAMACGCVFSPTSSFSKLVAALAAPLLTAPLVAFCHHAAAGFM
jgi:hypothetical protein